jgi:MFS family permease
MVVLLGGALVGNVGLWMYTTTLSWLTIRLTDGSAAALGLTSFATLVPFAVLTTAGGRLADRSDPRRVVLIANLGMTIALGVLGGLALIGSLTYPLLLASSVLISSALALSVPAGYTLLHGLAHATELRRAVAINLAQANLARIVGPILAGYGIAGQGEATVLLAAAATMSVFTVSVAVIESPRTTARLADLAQLRTSMWRIVLAGRDHRLLLITTLCLAVFVVPSTALVPFVSERSLGVGAVGFGILSAALGAGSMLGSLAGASRRSGIGAVVVASLVAAGGMAVFGFSTDFRIAAIALAVSGAGVYLATVSTQFLIQATTSVDQMGRMVALFQLAATGPLAICMLAVGALAGAFGASLVIGAGSLAMAVCIAISVVQLRHYRARRRRGASVGARTAGPTASQPNDATCLDVHQDSVGAVEFHEPRGQT